MPTQTDLSITADGPYGTPVVAGSTFEVIVFTQPVGQSCTVTNGTGTALADVTNIDVRCVATGAIPGVPTNLRIAYTAKRLSFTWDVTPNAATYQLQEDPDGPGPLPAAALGPPVTTTTATHVIPTLLHRALNARYAVQACNAAGCGMSSGAVTPDLNQAIGYFKASNTGAGDHFGDVQGLALSADGTTLAVGAYGEASNGSGPSDDSAPSAGAVYLFVRTQAGWSQQAYLKSPNPEANDFFGKALALSDDGNTLAVGVDGDDSDHVGVFATTPPHNNALAESGAVHVFTRSGTTWSQQAYLKASNAGQSDLFGFIVKLSSDGNTLAVGAFHESSASRVINANQADDSAFAAGAVYVFTRSGTVWSQQAYLKASNADVGDWFGIALALAGDGNTLAVGSRNEQSGSPSDPADNSLGAGAGAAYVFTRTGVTWSQQAYLKSVGPEAQDGFGVSLGLSTDGNTLLVGTDGDDSDQTGTHAVMPADNNLARNSGAAYVFTRNGTTWARQVFLKPSNTSPVQRFGARVSLSGDGNTAVIGAWRESSGSSGFGANPADVSAFDTGAAYVFVRSGGVWIQQRYLKAPNAQAEDAFGQLVELSRDGNTLAICASAEDSNATGIGGNQADNSRSASGAVYLY